MSKGFVHRLGSVLASWGIFGSEAPAATRDRRELRLVLPMAGERVWVGTLSRDRGEFVFTYSETFKQRDDLPCLAAFPDKEKEHRSRYLWPFFLARLPSTSRPEVERVIRDRAIDPEDKFVLLAEFGRKAVTTPYELEPTPAHAS